MALTRFQHDMLGYKTHFAKKLRNFVVSSGSFVFNMVNPSVDDKTIKRRSKKCAECPYQDMNGERLYRINKANSYSCGIPFFKKMFRDPEIDGCGCYLNLKWKKRFTHCPKGEW